MCVTDHHDITLAVKVALNSNTTNQPIKHLSSLTFIQRGTEPALLCRKHTGLENGLLVQSPGSVFTNYSQEHSLSFSPRFVTLNVTQLLIG